GPRGSSTVGRLSAHVLVAEDNELFLHPLDHASIGLEIAALLVLRRTARPGGPARAERQFATRMGAVTVEVPSSHVAMISHPQEITDLIEQAAETILFGPPILQCSMTPDQAA